MRSSSLVPSRTRSKVFLYNFSNHRISMAVFYLMYALEDDEHSGNHDQKIDELVKMVMDSEETGFVF